MKCDRCSREIPASEIHSHLDKKLCDDCYMDVMLQKQEKECDPWASYLSSKEMSIAGQKGAEALSEMEKGVYEFIKNKGRATREEVMAKFGISAEDLSLQLNVLMHAEMIKEHSEGGTMYLIPIPVSQ